jgi:hypothetical protein
LKQKKKLRTSLFWGHNFEISPRQIELDL